MKIPIYILLILLPFVSHAQTEQVGYVKTRGRMIGGRHIPGKGVTGAVVSIEGRNQIGVQNADGSFSFPVTDQTFIVRSVNREGYVIVDYDNVPGKFTCSSNPVYFIMEPPDQLLSDQLEIEGKIRKALRQQLEDRKKEIDRLKKKKRITEEQYKAALLKIYDDQSKEEKLIHDMAVRHSEVDYDQLDAFYRKVYSYIESGELSKAESLLKSRGDLHRQISAHLEQGTTIQEKEKELKRVKGTHRFDREEMARRCYSYYEKFHMNHQSDSAAHYLQLRARLDTTNVEWQYTAGAFIHEYLSDYNTAIQYFNRALRHSISMNGGANPDVAVLYNYYGRSYHAQGQYAKALKLYKQALEILQSFCNGQHPYLALTYNNIGAVEYSRGNYSDAMASYLLALNIWRTTCGDSHPNVASVYNNIAMVCDKRGNYEQALAFCNHSLEAYKSHYGDSHSKVATVYGNIGVIYYSQGNYSEAINHCTQALNIRNTIYGGNHPDVAISYNNIAMILYHQGSYDKALEYYMHSLKIWNSIFGEFHPYIATSYNNIGMIHHAKGNYELALEYHDNALRILKTLYDDSHPDIKVYEDNIKYIKGRIHETGGE